MVKTRIGVADTWLLPLAAPEFPGWVLPEGSTIEAVSVNFPFDAPKVDCVIELHTHSTSKDEEIELTEIHTVIHHNDIRASFNPIGQNGLVVPESVVLKIFFRGQGFNPEITILARMET